MTTAAKRLLQAPDTGGRAYSLKIAPQFAVDRSRGILRDVALLSVGEAKGHGIFIDERTIETAAEVVAARKGRLKAAFRHPSMLDQIMSHGADRMLEIPGYFSGVSGRGGQLVAGAFEFYDTFRKANGDACDTLIEMAEKTPELFGVSIEPYGYLAYVDAEDNEYSEPPIDVELRHGGMPALRVTDLAYAAFVDEPAANPGGLFATLSKIPGLGSLFGGARPGQLAALSRLAEAVVAFCKQGGPDSAASGIEPALAATTSEDSAMKILTDIKAKFGANPAQHARALALLTEDSTLTVDQVEVRLAAEERTALAAEVASLKAGIAERDTQIAALKAQVAERDTQLAADRAAAEAKLAAALNSGHPAPVGLGAGAGTGAGNQEQARPLFGLERVAAAFAAQENNPANRAGRN